MAYIVEGSALETAQQASGANYTVNLAPGTYAVNDLLLVFLKNNSGGTPITPPSGWAILAGQTNTVNVRTAVAWKVATSISETNDFKGTTIVNVVASSGTGTALLKAADGFSATGCAFTASATAVYGIRIADAGGDQTISLDATTFSGFTKDIDVTDANAGHTITINLADGQASPTYQTAGAVVDIVSSPVFQAVTISNAAAGSRIQIYDVAADVELYNDTSAFPFTWTDSDPAVDDRPIRLRVSKVSGSAAKEFIEANIGTCGTAAGTEAVSYLVNQVDDPTYNTNAIDGSTVAGITIEPSPSRVKIAIGGGSVTWPSIYAYQVYWLNTATGIADEAAFIDAPDTANYILSGFEVKNTDGSSTPLMVTGGWGRDAVTGLSKDIIDSAGGPIFLAPDHVVPFSTGSGLTAGQDASLTAAAAAASNAAAYAQEARKLLRNKRVLDPASGIETFYDDDGSPLYTRNVYIDPAAATPYNGTSAPHRVERYA